MSAVKDSTKSAVERANEALKMANDLLDDIDREFWADLELPAACPNGDWGCCRETEDVVTFGWNSYVSGTLGAPLDNYDIRQEFLADPQRWLQTRAFGYPLGFQVPGRPLVGQRPAFGYRDASRSRTADWLWNQGISSRDTTHDYDCLAEEWDEEDDYEHWCYAVIAGKHLSVCLIENCRNSVPQDVDHIGICDFCAEMLRGLS